MLAASHSGPLVNMPTGQTDRLTDLRTPDRYITHSASVISQLAKDRRNRPKRKNAGRFVTFSQRHAANLQGDGDVIFVTAWILQRTAQVAE